MSDSYSGYYGSANTTSLVSGRAAFIKRTYLHLTGAVLAFVGLLAVLFSSGVADQIVKDVFLANQWSWVGLMILFIVGGIGAQVMARSRASVGVQYAGLTLYVLLETLIFLPILYIAELKFPGENLPLQAGIVTLSVFAGLTIAVFVSGKDFSFLGPVVWGGSFLALGLVVAAVVGGFGLGLWFCAAMVGLAAAAIIYQTSNLVHQYGPDEHVAAALGLFASVAMLFWYILRIFMLSRNN